MKLRIYGNGLRLRLRQAEVSALCMGRAIEAAIEIGGRKLRYSLEPGKNDAVLAAFDGETIAVKIPASQLSGWDRDARVGIEGKHRGLEVLIEKDWKCIDPRDPSENEGCYENPDEACS